MNTEPWMDLLSFTDVLLAYTDGRRGPSAELIITNERGGVQGEDRRAFSQAVDDALVIAAGLRARGVAVGDVVFIALPTSQDFLDAWLACVFVGALPCAVPGGESTLLPFSRHVQSAADSLKPVLLLTTLAIAAASTTALRGVRACALATLRGHAPLSAADVVRPRPDGPLHLQLTSGSTGAPKAALLTHRNVIANVALTARAGQAERHRDVGVLWLPLFHDMGLIALLSALYHNCNIVLQAPEDFIRNPLGWLRHIARYGGTASAVPNFALAYCVRRYRADLMDGVDLSGLRALVVGAERVHVETLERFAECFQPHGFSGDAFFPCYGTAELTLAITMPGQNGTDPLGRNIRRDHGRRDPDGNTLGMADGHAYDTVLSMGRPLPTTTIAIRDAAGTPLGEGMAGQIHIRSACLMQGYYGDVEQTENVIRDGWYATGDHGYLLDGELFVLGREKELIILRGRNYFPHEFEECLSTHAEVDVGRVAAVGLADPHLGTERLTLVVEPARFDQLRQLRQELQSLLRERFGFGANELHFVSRGAIPRTTSRKIQRIACARQLASGELRPLPNEPMPATA